MNNELNSRIAALHLLQFTLVDKHPLLEGDHILREYSEQDATLAKAICQSVLRNIGTLSAISSACMEKPFKQNSTEQLILFIGIAQMLYMNSVPDHASINTTVNLAKEHRLEKISGIFNAVLRRIQRDEVPEIHPADYFPAWLKQQFRKDYGREKTAIIIEEMLKPANLHVRLRNQKLASEYKKIATNLIHNCWQVNDNNLAPKELPGFETGDIYISDMSAQMPATLLTNALANVSSPKILDLCSAPGGKTIQLIDLNPNAKVTAVDINPTRLKKIEENFERCNVKAEIITADATALPFEDNSFDAILLDVPCSAAGTIKRHPEIMWLRTKEHVNELIGLQQAMIKEAIRVLKPKGTLVYSTCSIFKAEGESQRAWAIRELNNVEFSPIKKEEVNGNEDWLNSFGDLRILPQHGGDGFFVARFIKN